METKLMWTNLEALPRTKYFLHFKDAVFQNVCTGHGLREGFSACYMQCECAT